MWSEDLLFGMSAYSKAHTFPNLFLHPAGKNWSVCDGCVVGVNINVHRAGQIETYLFAPIGLQAGAFQLPLYLFLQQKL
jgi:hypothetical protein